MNIMQEGIIGTGTGIEKSQNVILANYPGLKSKTLILETNMKVLALFDENIIYFRKSVEQIEDLQELVKWLESKGVKDTSIRNKYGKIIEDFEEAIGLDTFMFSGEASTHIIILFQDNLNSTPIFI